MILRMRGHVNKTDGVVLLTFQLLPKADHLKAPIEPVKVSKSKGSLPCWLFEFHAVSRK
jgi:hypothetical protein